MQTKLIVLTIAPAWLRRLFVSGIAQSMTDRAEQNALRELEAKSLDTHPSRDGSADSEVLVALMMKVHRAWRKGLSAVRARLPFLLRPHEGANLVAVVTLLREYIGGITSVPGLLGFWPRSASHGRTLRIASVVFVVWLAATAFASSASALRVIPWIPQRTASVARADLEDGVLGKSKAELLAQRRHSAGAISYFLRGPTNWKIARRHKTCAAVQWTNLCRTSREQLAKHRWLFRIADDEYQRRYGLGLIRDWRSAVTFVQRWFPGTQRWLMDCSSSEGGHGLWVPNRHGSGAGGWMQYMSGTFTTDYNAAVAYLRSRGVSVPPSTASWYSPLGQAIAAGWARYSGHAPRGKWTGANC